MKTIIKTAIFLCASALLQTAYADQQFSYTETFTSVTDASSSFVLYGTFNESDAGVLTSLSSSVIEHGNVTLEMNITSLSAVRFVQLPQAMTNGLPLQINGYFIGLSGNRNTITSCGQVFLDGDGCASWQSVDPSVPSQGLTNIRTQGAGAGGNWLSQDTFSQTGALQIAAVPEPGAAFMLFAGLGLLFAVGRQKRRAGYK